MSCETEPQGIERELYDLWAQLLYGRSCLAGPRNELYTRQLIVTPFEGNYGLAGYVLVMNGSPPKGVIIIVANDEIFPIESCSPVFFLSGGKARHLGSAQAELVRRYLRDRQGRLKSLTGTAA